MGDRLQSEERVIPKVTALRERDEETLREMSMVDMVFLILKEAGQPQPFDTLYQEAAALKGFSEEEKGQLIARLFTEINVDGRFKFLGDNLWGLRSWYPVDQAEEFFVSVPKKKKKRDLDDDDYDDLAAMDELEDEELDDEEDLKGEEDYFDDELDVDVVDDPLDDEFPAFEDLDDEESAD